MEDGAYSHVFHGVFFLVCNTCFLTNSAISLLVHQTTPLVFLWYGSLNLSLG